MLDARSTRAELLERFDAHPPDAFGLLRYSGDCMITGAVAAAVRAHALSDALEPDLAEMLEAVLEANGERNERLVEASVRYARILADAGIAPVALKGAAVILEGLHEEPGARMASDIDLLVPPTALAEALAALRDAGCLQVGNKYDPRHAGRPPGEALVDPADFRNDPRHAFYHVPAIRLPDTDVNLELHTALAPATLPMARWLNDATLVDTRPLVPAPTHERALDGVRLRVPAPTARLLHNFHHSQIKDRLGALGVTDWRHLLDARRTLEVANDPALVGRLRERAAVEGLGAELELHLWQLRELLGAPVPETLPSAAARRRIAAFVRRRDSAPLSRLAGLEHFWRRRTRDLLSPSQLRRYHGPRPYPLAVAEAVRFRGANALRLVGSGKLGRLLTGR